MFRPWDSNGLANAPPSVGEAGLKTTRDLVSAYGHIPPMPELRLERNPELLSIGPLARSAADLSLVLEVIAGPRDPQVALRNALPPARTNAPKGLRVALWLSEAFAPVDAPAEEAVHKAALVLEAAGASVDESTRPAFSFEEAFEVAAVFIHALVSASLPEKVRQSLAAAEHEFLLGDLSHRALQLRGFNLTTPDLTERRRRMSENWARFFEEIDVVLCPPAPVGAILHDHRPELHARSISVNGTQRPYYDLMLWSCLATGAGLPAAVAPIMLGPDGLPRGVQIIAAKSNDRAAIACATMLEALGACVKAPPIAP